MVRELRRLLIPPDRLAAAGDPAKPGLRLQLLPAERHYLARVLRYRQGERLALVDGCGGRWTAELTGSEALRLEQSLEAPLERQPPPRPPLELALALPRRDVDLVWRMATELGLDRLQPLRATRCVAKQQAPLERWRSVVAEASEQCERLWMPTLAPPLAALSWLAQPPPAGGWAGGNRRFLATTRREGMVLLPAVLQALAVSDAPVVVAVGPEGGWTPEEEAAALAAGWQAVSLGPLILRSGTAAVTAAAQLASWRALLSAPAV